MKRLRILVIALVVLAASSLLVVGLTPRVYAGTLFGSTRPDQPADVEAKSVELGVQFSSDVAGQVTGVRFYKSPSNTGRHVGTLWNSDGDPMARVTFERESGSGWQEARFVEPVAIAAGVSYTASYLAPEGRYAGDHHAFDQPYRTGHLTVPAGGGLYAYGAGGFPRNNWLNTNYYVDVLFEPAGATPPVITTTASTTAPTTTAQPTTAPTSTTPTATTGPGATTLSLPRIPWEGGSGYWKRFAKTNAVGWDDPSFFPIVVWFNGISSDEEVKYDKKAGVNTYIGMWEGTPYHLFADNRVYWIGGALNDSFTPASRNWVGDFLDDEVDGRFSPQQGFAHLAALRKPLEGNGRFKYANYTQMVMSKDMSAADAERYVSGFTDAVSIDMYFYTIPHCNLIPYRDTYLTPVERGNCRTASSYGKTMKSLRARDAADGNLQAIWQFVELLNGGPGEGPWVGSVNPGQLKGAVMSSVINEARGIVYFNQSFTGPCTGSALIRQAQVTSGFCGARQVAAATEVNQQIHRLARVLNSQSYEHSFGPGLDTMLKAYNGSVYVFAMVDGSSKPGSRTMTLPDEVHGRRVEVLNENRKLTADANGTFTDTFAAEYSYHVYKVAK